MNDDSAADYCAVTTTFSSLFFGSRSVIFVVFFERIMMRLFQSEKDPFE
jgi:hypothetical protein